MKFLVIYLSRVERGLREGHGGGDQTNVLCNPIVTFNFPCYEYILIKMNKKNVLTVDISRN
jgi:hypothetical protein